jgi:REP element-mobilizing transposase RayT
MDRYWLLTWTTYGAWLPGDRRGFVGRLRDENGLPYIHNLPGTPCDADIQPLERAMRAAMKGPPIRLTTDHAQAAVAQFQETAAYRGWTLLAAAVMANHAHLVVGVPGDPDPEQLLHSFKSYASRVLNRRCGKPVNGTWWTESGSKRKLPDETAVRVAVVYVRDQPYPLLVWLPGAGEVMIQTPRS